MLDYAGFLFTSLPLLFCVSDFYCWY